jgi:hypothetical protein
LILVKEASAFNSFDLIINQGKLFVTISHEEDSDRLSKTLDPSLFDPITRGMAWLANICLMAFILCTTFIGGIIVETLWY